MHYEKFSDIIRDPHFVRLAALVRYPFGSQKWKKDHPKVRFWSLIKELENGVYTGATPWDKTAVIGAITNLLTAIVGADSRLSYSQEDMEWLIQAIDSDQHKVIISMWMASFSAPDDFFTPVEVAELTNTHESGWRNKASAGEIPGAFKKGKQWILPRSGLRSIGVDLNAAEGS